MSQSANEPTAAARRDGAPGRPRLLTDDEEVELIGRIALVIRMRQSVFREDIQRAAARIVRRRLGLAYPKRLSHGWFRQFMARWPVKELVPRPIPAMSERITRRFILEHPAQFAELVEEFKVPVSRIFDTDESGTGILKQLDRHKPVVVLRHTTSKDCARIYKAFHEHISYAVFVSADGKATPLHLIVKGSAATPADKWIKAIAHLKNVMPELEGITVQATGRHVIAWS